MSRLTDLFLTAWTDRWPEAAPDLEHKFHPTRRWRFDVAWVDQRVAVELHGFGYGHQSLARFAADCEKVRAALELGWLVVPFTSKCLGSKEKRQDAVELVMVVLMTRAQEYTRSYAVAKKLPFGVKFAPRCANTKAVLVDVEDHLGSSTVHINTWWSGEGMTIQVESQNKERTIDLSWSEWEAIKLAVVELVKADNKT